MNITGFPSPDETQERLPVDTHAPDLDRISRADSIRKAVAITRMEGGQPSAYCREQLALFEASAISAAEMRDRVIRNARG
jgi:hypothetical protein